MKKSETKIVGEDKDYVYSQISTGAIEGFVCPECGIIYVVIATTDPKTPAMPILPQPGHDNYCPCCGVNVRKYLEPPIKAG